MNCPHCGAEMSSLGVNHLQLGRVSALGGSWGQLFSGALEVEIHLCQHCGKLEFFAVPQERDPALLQVPCPHCGAMHDFDDAKCPVCRKRLMD